jgi:hypothetical protein
MGRQSKQLLVSRRLTTSFQKDLFAAALKSLEQVDNPLWGIRSKANAIPL